MGKSKALIIGHIGKGNFGDDFMAVSLLNFLIQKYPDSKFVCFSNKKILDNNKVIFKKENILNFICEIITCKTIIVNGGNFLHDYNLNFRFRFSPFLKFSLISLFSFVFRKKLIYSGQGFGPFKSSWSKQWFNLLMKFPSFISVRDGKSLEIFKRYNPKNSKIFLTSDSTFMAHPLKCEPRRNKDLNLGINLLPFFELYKNSRIKDNYFLASIKKIINKLIEEENINPKIYLVVFSVKNNEKELSFLKKLKNNLNTQAELIIYDCVDKFITEFNDKIDFFIGMRLHGIILSRLLCKPQFNLSYHNKCQNIIKKIELDEAFSHQISSSLSLNKVYEDIVSSTKKTYDHSRLYTFKKEALNSYLPNNIFS